MKMAMNFRLSYTLIVLGSSFLCSIERLPELVESGAEYRIKFYPSTNELEEDASCYEGQYLDAVVINTSMNNVGISSSDVCAYSEMPTNDNNSREGIIVCKSGRRFRQVIQEKGSSTGTPGYLYYDNYIGQRIIPGRAGMPGAGKRITYCAGPCEKSKR